MNKHLLLTLLLPLQVMATPETQKATIELFAAVDQCDELAVQKAVEQGADVNAINLSTGLTPLMTALEKSIEVKRGVYSRRSATVACGVMAGIVSGAVIGTAGVHRAQAHWATSSKKVKVGWATSIATAAIAGGIVAGSMTHDLCASLFGMRELQRKDHRLERIIYALSDHPQIDFTIRHDLTGKSALHLLSEIINPHRLTHAVPDYGTIELGQNDLFNINILGTNIHPNLHTSYTRPISIRYFKKVEFMVFGKLYQLDEEEYNDLKVFYEAFARYLIHRKKVKLVYSN